MVRDPSKYWCNSPDHVRPGFSRRECVFVGLIGGLGLTLGDYLGLQGQARGADAMWSANVGVDKTPKDPPAKSCIHIYLPGGMAHQESWDPKPLAPVEYRGSLGTVKTKIDGEYFSEMMKHSADVADKICVIRSFTHGEAAHERGTHNMFTGYRPSPALQFPSFGSTVSHELGTRNNMPPYVCVPSMPNTYAGSGYLSAAYGPFSLGSDPANGGFTVRDLNLASGVDDKRFERRKDILATVDNHFRAVEKSDALDAMNSFYQNAYGLISSKAAREAFDLKSEPDNLKDAYGRNQAGMRMLMARRLVEGGVRFVSLTYGGWDHHTNVAQGFRQQMPAFDQAFAALIRDLDNRKILDSTLIMVSSEFGRSSKINKDQGRDHWPKVFSVVLAGGGIKKGMIYGSSDATAAEPQEKPVEVADLAMTIYNRLGINGAKKLMAPGGRPIDIVRGGNLIEDIMV